MRDKPVIYIRQPGEARVPVTVRLEWLPDGAIKPLTYWTPDDSRFEIRHIYEMTPMAFLKDRGEGIRFKVRAEVTEASESFSEHLHALYETYLYLADNLFYGKGFIDGRYGHEGKEFISVIMDVFPNCKYELVYFKAQGLRYAVEQTLAIEPRGSFRAGGVGLRHKVEARQINADNDNDPDPERSILRIAGLYLEIDKWFVSVKT